MSLQASAFLAGVRAAAHAAGRAPLWPPLRDAGYRAGVALLPAFGAWLAVRGEPAPDRLPEERLGPYLSGYLEELGWGHLTLVPAGPSLLQVDVYDWAEAPGVEGRPVTTGLLAGVLGAVADTPLGVLEVPPHRDGGSGRGRFLVGAGVVLQEIHAALARGQGMDAVLAWAARSG
ncbi:MAG: hypothetical protein KJT01_05395 [Gemmatimonadetes bacterium]|nr:hypothetical protein [Gemmatimonadota bacterium]